MPFAHSNGERLLKNVLTPTVNKSRGSRSTNISISKSLWSVTAMPGSITRSKEDAFCVRPLQPASQSMSLPHSSISDTGREAILAELDAGER